LIDEVQTQRPLQAKQKSGDVVSGVVVALDGGFLRGSPASPPNKDLQPSAGIVFAFLFIIGIARFQY
jgi:hypothetical protein